MVFVTRPAAILQGALLCCALAACAQGTQRRTIGVSIQNLHSEFYTEVYDGIASQAKADGYKILSGRAEDAETAADQQSQIEWFIENHVDAIVIAPINSKSRRERRIRGQYGRDSGFYNRYR